MDITLIAALVLAATTASFAWIAEARRRTINGLNESLAHNQAHQHERLQAHGRTNLIAGYKLAQGDIYVAVVKADNRGEDVVTAVRNTLPPVLLEQANERLEWIKV